MEITPDLFLGGKYPNSPLRHRHEDKETLRDFLQNRNYQLNSDAFSASIFVARDHENLDLEILARRKKANKYSVLLRSEPSCVLPDAYEPRTTSLYNRIITFGKIGGNDTSLWPQYWNLSDSLHISEERKNHRVALVNANKLSLFPSELYSLRRQIIAYSTSLDLFGDGWNDSKFSRIRTLIIELRKQAFDPLGKMQHTQLWFKRWPYAESPENKFLTLQDYKVNLVIENDPSYLSEKIFDAFSAGCIPVYVGPKIEDYGIPKSLAFQAEPTVESIQKAIRAAFEIDHPDFLLRVKKWLASTKTREMHGGLLVMERVFTNLLHDYSKLDLIVE